jgi:hypothetical protein
MDIWRGMDTYLINADRNLCSAACPCYINNPGVFTQNSTVAPFYNNWATTNNNLGATRFQDCPLSVKLATYNAALADPAFNPTGNFVAERFWNYMAKTEDRFTCTGYCVNNYVNPINNQRQFMFKYLFSNINRGIPLYSGCIDVVLNWLPRYLLAFGAVGLALSFFQVKYIF